MQAPRLADRPADGHAECSVTEHLDTYQLSARTANALFLYLPVYVGHLRHIQFAGQHHDIGKLGIEFQRFDVADVQLGGQVYLLPYLSAVHHDGYVRSYDSGDVGFLGCIYDGTHQRKILAVDDGVYRQIALDAVCGTSLCHFLQVVNGERTGRMRPHVQVFDAEVYGVGSGFDGCGQ